MSAIRTTDSSGRVWIKAGASSTSDCVEVHFRPDGVDLRNSKNPQGPVISYTKSEWAAFMTGIKDGDFERPI